MDFSRSHPIGSGPMIDQLTGAATLYSDVCPPRHSRASIFTECNHIITFELNCFDAFTLIHIRFVSSRLGMAGARDELLAPIGSDLVRDESATTKRQTTHNCQRQRQRALHDYAFAASDRAAAAPAAYCDVRWQLKVSQDPTAK